MILSQWYLVSPYSAKSHLTIHNIPYYIDNIPFILTLTINTIHINTTIFIFPLIISPMNILLISSSQNQPVTRTIFSPSCTTPAAIREVVADSPTLVATPDEWDPEGVPTHTEKCVLNATIIYGYIKYIYSICIYI